MKTYKSVLFGRVRVEKTTYSDGNLAILLVSDEDNEDIATLSVNLPAFAHHLKDNEFFPKMYSDNAELAREAIVLGPFTDTGRRVNTPIGYTSIWRCK